MPVKPPKEPKYFATPAAFRAWLERHASSATELVVGFHKRDSGEPSITWPEAVDEALSFGWIDGVRKRIDDRRYQIRFTPRKATSTWSAVNIERVRVLTSQGRMTPAGLDAFARRTASKSGTYAYEQAAAAELDAAEISTFKKNKAAWSYFQAQAPSYRQKVIWRIVSVKQAATRVRRFAQLVEACAKSTRL